ncbi:hypothetical protein JHK82_035563 [Glycine max]|uniref:Uncharacterized protein n=2 Tax=Glycine subgen. Soja TaxID=1462606 RepID=K7LX97_SOYBN|nr:hypothetical protein JHK85_036287 [Glycine max]KHN43690.1 hypothetical protein glysoja_043213 [Glycine soja]KAG4976222.1 hypothetical protein JHK86_035696 [Glycine max]KAG5112294.1 hypothetical protein JHK82_035563 [Glycine max]KAG5129574.1 hypothetical protein JHK84_035971 [Glycine max]
MILTCAVSFPQYVASHINTPIFIVYAAYDSRLDYSVAQEVSVCIQVFLYRNLLSHVHILPSIGKVFDHSTHSCVFLDSKLEDNIDLV